jgi:aminocarboxymuconate-semialdehyde decarboxylase
MLYHTCRCAVHSSAGSGASGGGDPRTALNHCIDMHCHIFVPSIERLVGGRAEKQAEATELARGLGSASTEYNAKIMLPKAVAKLTDFAIRFDDMRRMGVDVQVLSPSPNQYYYWAEPELAAQLVREQNEAIADACEKSPRSLRGLGNVALQHPSLAEEQLKYAVRQLGLKGVEISTSINGVDLGDPTLQGFWKVAHELECIVFIHPFGTSLGARLNRYYLGNIIGQPIETTIALSDLIFSATLDRFPSVKLLAAHGGGYLPAYVGRSNHGYQVRPEAKLCRHAPEEYLRKMWFDSLVFNTQELRALIAQVGVSQVVIGTDYPFDMGSYTPRDLIAGLEGLSEEDRVAILARNALHLLGEGV